MGLLDGKIAVVTGSGGGIGREHALALAKEGAALVVNDLGGARDGTGAGHSMADEVVAEIKAAGGEAVANYDSVATVEGANNIVKTALDAFDKLDIVVNNAGLALVAGAKDLWETSDDEWRREIDVNLNGVFHCCKAAALLFIEQGEGGRIVNLSSLAGFRPQPQYGGYTPAKFAVNGLTQMLALELAPHKVTVNAVLPGSTDTDMMDGTFRRTADRMGIPFEAVKGAVPNFIPLSRQATPEDIAGAVAYLASPDADYVTGQIISIDGGAGLR